MAQAPPGSPGQPAPRPLPPGLDLLWGRRERGKRGPRPGLSADAIVAAAVRVADADGLEAVSMARVAAELGFTTMSLYRYVASKEELLQLMFNASALGAERLVLEGDDWRSRLRAWSEIQWEMLGRHPWITQMPMPAPPLSPSSMHFVERGLQAMDGTGLPDAEKIRVIGLLTSYTLNEARMAYDAARAAQAAQAGQAGQAGQAQQVTAGEQAGQGAPFTYEELLRELVDEQTYPRLYRLAWSAPPDARRSEHEEFLSGVDLVLDGVAALIDRTHARDGEAAGGLPFQPVPRPARQGQAVRDLGVLWVGERHGRHGPVDVAADR
jgi:AcrR family transcriptional regulator